MVIEHFPEIRRLSSAEKLIFVSELWDDLAEHPAELPVEIHVVEELDRRMQEFKSAPEKFTTWEEIQQKILGSRT